MYACAYVCVASMRACTCLHVYLYSAHLVLVSVSHNSPSSRYVKLSSPNLNNLMLVGGMMDYMAVILFGLDAVSVSNVAFDILCTVGDNSL